MLALDPAPIGEAAITVASPTFAVGSLAAIGLLGVTDWILGDDEPPESPEEPAGDGGSGMFGEPETAGDGGMAGGGDTDDEFAFDEDEDDAFDEFDVGGMDEGDGGGAQTRELEGRIEELEDEISGISSTVSTVRTENEQISESVDDIEENVRKLLDIYKMVTKGVNPFVDEDGGGGGGFAGADGSSLGLFDQDDEEEDEQPENLDPDVTDADAEEFFDDDFEDDEEIEEEEVTGEESAEDSVAEASEESMAQSDDAPTDDEGGAKSFDELREEYEDGAEWSEAEDESDGEDADAETADDVEADADATGGDETEAAVPDESGDSADDGAADERVDDLFDEDAEESVHPEDGGAHQPAAQPVAPPTSRAPPRSGARQPVGDGAAGEKPYLRELPSGYVSDLLVMEWVEFLVAESSPSGAHRAITYYENVGWVGHRAADQLREFVDGHPETSVEDDSDESGALSMEHHTTSLRYVARITGDVQENVLASWDDGDNRWLQR